MDESFAARAMQAVRDKGTVLCAGLDPQLSRILATNPKIHAHLRSMGGDGYQAVAEAIVRHNRQIIDEVAPFAVAVKPNLAFYECYGHWGVLAYEETLTHARRRGLLVVGDGKRGDGGDTAIAYAEGHLGERGVWDVERGEIVRQQTPMRVETLTINPSIGDAWLDPLLQQMAGHGTGAFVVVRTSFKPDSRFETQLALRDPERLVDALHALALRPEKPAYDEVNELVAAHACPMWQIVAAQVATWGERVMTKDGRWSNLGVVMGTTKVEDTPTMRRLVPKAIQLAPGYGAQGGGAEGAVMGALPDGTGILVVTARGICYPQDGDHAAEAKRVRDELNLALEVTRPRREELYANL